MLSYRRNIENQKVCAIKFHFIDYDCSLNEFRMNKTLVNYLQLSCLLSLFFSASLLHHHLYESSIFVLFSMNRTQLISIDKMKLNLNFNGKEKIEECRLVFLSIHQRNCHLILDCEKLCSDSLSKKFKYKHDFRHLYALNFLNSNLNRKLHKCY